MVSLIRPVKKELKGISSNGICFAKFGPTFVKYSQNWFAISNGCDNVLFPWLNVLGRGDFLLDLLITSFIIFQVSFKLFLAKVVVV